MANVTSIAVGCAVGIPCFLAFCVALIFWTTTRRRFVKEDLEFNKKHEADDFDRDLSYNNIEQLKLQQEHDVNNQSEPSEDSDQSRHPNQQEDEDEKEKNGVERNDSRKTRYVPAYRKKMKATLNTSRNSSFTNLGNGQSNNNNNHTTSNSSITSNTTNHTDYLYNNVPVIDSDGTKQVDSSSNSLELARSLQQPTPSYSKKQPVFNRSTSVSTNNDDDAIEDDYDLKNNYKLENEHEIQEEDQYENEFTNYSENKRAYIDSLRPKK